MAIRKLIDQNFEMHSGDTKDIIVEVLKQDDSVQPLTGATARFALSEDEFEPAIVTKTTGAGIVLTDPPAGILTVTLDAVDTEPLAGMHYYEVEVTDVALRISTVAVGWIDIRKNLLE